MSLQLTLYFLRTILGIYHVFVENYLKGNTVKVEQSFRNIFYSCKKNCLDINHVNMGYKMFSQKKNCLNIFLVQNKSCQYV